MVKVIVNNIIHHFVSDLNGSVNGLYEVVVNDTKATIFRNGDSWGALSHYIGRDVKKCIDFIRDEIKHPIADAVEIYLNKDIPEMKKLTVDELRRQFESAYDIPDFINFDGIDYMCYEDDPVLQENCTVLRAEYGAFKSALKINNLFEDIE